MNSDVIDDLSNATTKKELRNKCDFHLQEFEGKGFLPEDYREKSISDLIEESEEALEFLTHMLNNLKNMEMQLFDMLTLLNFTCEQENRCA